MPFAVPFAISLDSNWVLRGERADGVAFEHSGDPAGWLEAVLLTAALDPPCRTTEPQFIGERPEDVMGWLSSRPWLNPTDPRPYNIGTYLGRAIDVEVPAEGGWTCEGGHEAGKTAFIFELGSPMDTDPNCCRYWGGDSGERYRMIAIEVRGRSVVFTLGRTADAESFWRLSEPFLQTIEFEEPAS